MYQEMANYNTPQTQTLAFSTGKSAAQASHYRCDYHTPACLFSKFCDGFVAQGATQKDLPENTPDYLVGRVAYLKGLSPSKPPGSNTNSFSGQWLSGWLAQQIKQHFTS